MRPSFLRRIAPPLALALLLIASGCRRKQPVPPAAGSALPVVSFFDVGQGDSALVQTPQGANVLFDTGLNGHTAAFLRERGVRRIDLLVISHPHHDHDGGLRAIAKQFEIARVWHSGMDEKGAVLRELRDLPAEVVAAGTQASFGALRLTVLHPNDGAAPHRDVNDNSVVVKAEYGGTSYLFPGDCELPCWEDMFRAHRSELRSDVLKAAHHGSGNGTNSGVLINVRPKVFVISCGRDNKYGHPDPLVVRLVDKLGAKILRTDEMGTIRCAGADCGPAGELTASGRP